MSPARNDPCPCGSGRKYKHCCMWKDNARSTGTVPAASEAVRKAAAAAAWWEVDALPGNATFRNEPDARPVMVLITADGFTIHQEVHSRIPGEPEAVARVLADAVRAAMRSHETRPAFVKIRHAAVCVALDSLLVDEGIEVDWDPSLPDIDRVYSVLSERSGQPDAPPSTVSVHPMMWAGWQIEPETIRALFEGAATYWRAAAWEDWQVDDVMVATFPEGHILWAQVLGSEGLEPGLGLYQAFEDLASQFDPQTLEEWPNGVIDEVVTMLYLSRASFPRETVREIEQANWPVADRDAYPFLTTIGLPAGGVSEQRARDLARALGAVPRLTEEIRAGRVDADDLDERPWTDPVSGIRLSREPFTSGAWEDLGDLMIERPVLPGEIRPTAPEGPGALPTERVDTPVDIEVLEGDSDVVLERWKVYLREEGLKPKTAQAHLGNASLLLDFMVQYQGVSPRGFREYDLRVFMFDWYPRKVISTRTEDLRMVPSLRKFFKFLREEYEVHYPWAKDLLKEWKEVLEYGSGPEGPLFLLSGSSGLADEAYFEMGRLVMLPDSGLGEDDTWGDYMGWHENNLFIELQDRWLAWRDELIGQGIDDPVRLGEELTARQREWEARPHPGYGGKTPIAVILKEREEIEALL